MEIVDLVKFGMTPTEARVYLVVLSLGETKIGPAIKKTGLHRGTVYNAIDSLIKKEFVCYIDTEDSRLYSSSGAKVFEKIIEGRKKEIDLDKERIKSLKKTEIVSDKEFDVKVLVGEEGFKQFVRSLIEWAHKTKEEYLFIGRGQQMIKHFGEDYYAYTQNLKKKLGVKCRALLSSLAKNESISKTVYGNVRYFSWQDPTPTSAWVYDDKVVIALWESKPVRLIMIRNKEVNRAYRNYFEAIWRFAITRTTEIHEIREKKQYFSLLTKDLLSHNDFRLICPAKVMPFGLFYPKNEKDIIRIRRAITKDRTTLMGADESTINLIKTYWRIFKEGKKFKTIIDKESIDYYFNIFVEVFSKTRLKELIIEIKKDLKKYNIKASVIDKPFPYWFFVSNKMAMSFISFSEVVNGMAIIDKKTVDRYRAFFESLFNTGKDLEIVLNDYLEKC